MIALLSFPGSRLGTQYPEALPRCFSLRIALLAFSFLACTKAAAADPPGLIQEQPNSGRFVKTDQGYMVPYQQTIPGSDATFEMQPIPGGKFLLGSPESEPGHKPDEA